MVTRVKVCGLTRLEDAEGALAAGADALGFVFDPASPRFVGSDALPRQLSSDTLTVAVFGSYRAMSTGCRLVQCTEGGPDAQMVRALRLGPDATVASVLAQLAGEATAPVAVLLDAFVAGVSGGTGHTVDWGLAAELVQAIAHPVVLAGGLHAGNVAEAVRLVRPYAVDASSGLELAPGIKDPDKVRAFVDAAKGA